MATNVEIKARVREKPKSIQERRKGATPGMGSISAMIRENSPAGTGSSGISAAA